ncbi:unnamed protein product [Closterium sp. NIES-53]
MPQALQLVPTRTHLPAPAPSILNSAATSITATTTTTSDTFAHAAAAPEMYPIRTDSNSNRQALTTPPGPPSGSSALVSLPPPLTGPPSASNPSSTAAQLAAAPAASGEATSTAEPAPPASAAAPAPPAAAGAATGGGSGSGSITIPHIPAPSFSSSLPPSLLTDLEGIPPCSCFTNSVSAHFNPHVHAIRYTGVRSRGSNRWIAEIKDNQRGVRKWLGTFSCPVQAAHAFDAAARAVRGPNARTNFRVGETVGVPGTGGSRSRRWKKVAADSKAAALAAAAALEAEAQAGGSEGGGVGVGEESAAVFAAASPRLAAGAWSLGAAGGNTSSGMALQGNASQGNAFQGNTSNASHHGIASQGHTSEPPRESPRERWAFDLEAVPSRDGENEEDAAAAAVGEGKRDCSMDKGGHSERGSEAAGKGLSTSTAQQTQRHHSSLPSSSWRITSPPSITFLPPPPVTSLPSITATQPITSTPPIVSPAASQL